LLFWLSLFVAGTPSYQTFTECRGHAALIVVPVTDLMATPAPRPCCPVNFDYDANQLTQLLFQEPIIILESSDDGWSYIEVPEQPNFVNGSWGGYRGWVPSSHYECLDFDPPPPSFAVTVPWANVFSQQCHLQGCLPNNIAQSVSFGTWLSPIGAPQYGWQEVSIFGVDGNNSGWLLESDISSFYSPDQEPEIRYRLPYLATRLLGWLYFWGGRSAFSFPMLEQGQQLTGVDCSGLVSILYRSCGIVIPRDASKQAMWVNNVTTAKMQVGDVFFFGVPFSSAQPVGHVMMLWSLSPPSIVESAYNSTRIIPIETAFGLPLHQLRWGQPLQGGMNPGEFLSWGTFFPFTKRIK